MPIRAHVRANFCYPDTGLNSGYIQFCGALKRAFPMGQNLKMGRNFPGPQHGCRGRNGLFTGLFELRQAGRGHTKRVDACAC
jgi:hypothetical protein